MENSEATTSKVVDSASATCKGCKKVLSDSIKLKHIIHSPCRQHYSKKEMDYFRDLAAERKSLKDKEYYHKNKESMDHFRISITKSGKYKVSILPPIPNVPFAGEV